MNINPETSLKSQLHIDGQHSQVDPPASLSHRTMQAISNSSSSITVFSFHKQRPLFARAGVQAAAAAMILVIGGVIVSQALTQKPVPTPQAHTSIKFTSIKQALNWVPQKYVDRIGSALENTLLSEAEKIRGTGEAWLKGTLLPFSLQQQKSEAEE